MEAATIKSTCRFSIAAAACGGRSGAKRCSTIHCNSFDAAYVLPTPICTPSRLGSRHRITAASSINKKQQHQQKKTSTSIYSKKQQQKKTISSIYSKDHGNDNGLFAWRGDMDLGHNEKDEVMDSQGENQWPWPWLKQTALALATGAAFFFCNIGMSSQLTRMRIIPLVAQAHTQMSTSQQQQQEAGEEKERSEHRNAYFWEEGEQGAKNKQFMAQTKLLREKLKKRDFGAALKLLDKLSQADPFESLWQVLRAKCLYYSGDYDRARATYRLVLQLSPFHPDAITGLITLMEKCNEKHAIIPFLEGTLQQALREGDEWAVKNMRLLAGRQYMIEKRYDEALKNYQEMEVKEPDFIPCLWQGILYYTVFNDKEKAQQKFEKCQQLLPKDFQDKIDIDELFSALIAQLKEETPERDAHEILVRDDSSRTSENSSETREYKLPSDSSLDNFVDIQAEAQTDKLEDGENDRLVTEENAKTNISMNDRATETQENMEARGLLSDDDHVGQCHDKDGHVKDEKLQSNDKCCMHTASNSPADSN